MQTDREYYGKAFRIIRLVRYIILIILVLFTVFSITFYSDEITFDNFRYMMKYIEFSPPSAFSGTDNIQFNASSEADFASIGNTLIVTSPKKIVSYDTNGRKILDEDVNYQNLASVSNDKYILLYDLDGYSLSVYNSFSKVFEKTLDTSIDLVYLSDDGAFAVITHEKSYAGGVVVFNSNFKQVFSFMTRSSNITDVCFDGNQNLLACATTDVRDGDFYSEIFTFDITNDENYKSRIELFGEMPLSMFCTGSGFAVMTDAGIHYYDFDGQNKAYVDFEYDTPDSIYRFDNFFAVTLKSALATADTSVKIYDYSGNLLFEKNYASDVSHIDASDSAVYILCQSELDIYGYNSEYIFDTTNKNFYQSGEYKKVFASENNSCFLISSDGAQRISADSVTSESSDAETPEKSDT